MFFLLEEKTYNFVFFVPVYTIGVETIGGSMHTAEHNVPFSSHNYDIPCYTSLRVAF